MLRYLSLVARQDERCKVEGQRVPGQYSLSIQRHSTLFIHVAHRVDNTSPDEISCLCPCTSRQHGLSQTPRDECAITSIHHARHCHYGRVLISTSKPAFSSFSRYETPKVLGVNTPPPSSFAKDFSLASINADCARQTPVRSYMLPRQRIFPYTRFGSLGSDTSALAIARHSTYSCSTCL